MASMLFDSGLSGEVASLRIQDFECPLRGASDLSARFQLINTLMLGQSIDEITLLASQQGDNYLIDLSGNQVQGAVSVDNRLQYKASGEMQPPGALAGMMATLARPLGNGSYAWEIEGQVPC